MNKTLLAIALAIVPFSSWASVFTGNQELIKQIAIDSEVRSLNNPNAKSLIIEYDGVNAVLVSDVVQEYKSNEIAGDYKYKGKQLLIHGVIASIASDVNNQPVIHFKGEDLFNGASAKFKKPDIERIIKLKKGEALSLVCYGAGEVVSRPMFNSCEFTEDYGARVSKRINAELTRFMTEKGSGEYNEYITSVVINTYLMADKLMPETAKCWKQKSACSEELREAIASISKEKKEILKEEIAQELINKGFKIKKR